MIWMGIDTAEVSRGLGLDRRILHVQSLGNTLRTFTTPLLDPIRPKKTPHRIQLFHSL